MIKRLKENDLIIDRKLLNNLEGFYNYLLDSYNYDVDVLEREYIIINENILNDFLNDNGIKCSIDFDIINILKSNKLFIDIMLGVFCNYKNENCIYCNLFEFMEWLGNKK